MPLHLYFLLAESALAFTSRAKLPLSCRVGFQPLWRSSLGKTEKRYFPITRSQHSGSPDTNAKLSPHTKNYRISGTGHQNKVTVVTDTGHSISTDIPRKMGGTDEAPQPIETLLAALVGCTQATAHFVSRQMSPRLVIGKMEFDIFASRDERGALQLPIEVIPDVPSRLEAVRGIVRVYSNNGQAISLERLNLLRDQTEARCPVANMMLASGCHLDISWVDGNT